MYSDMMRLASSYLESFTLWMHSVLKIEKKFSDKALSYGVPGFENDCIKPYPFIKSPNDLDV